MQNGNWRKVRKSAIAECRYYVVGEDLTGVTVSERDIPEDGGVIMRNPINPGDQWYVNPEFFAENYVSAE